jgi:hypothetical protein
VIVGASISLTVTVNVHESLFPNASVATIFTGVTPTAKTEPDAGVATDVTPGQLSSTVGVKFTLVPHESKPFERTIGAGHWMVGFCVSFTVTVNVHESLFPDASVATIFTGVMPTGKNDPDAGVLTIVTGPGQ